MRVKKPKAKPYKKDARAKSLSSPINKVTKVFKNKKKIVKPFRRDSE